MKIGWVDDKTWRAWIGPLFVGYAIDYHPFTWQWMNVQKRTAITGDRFRCVVLGRRTFAIGIVN